MEVELRGEWRGEDLKLFSKSPETPPALREISSTPKTLSTLNTISQGCTPTHAHTNVSTQTHMVLNYSSAHTTPSAYCT